MSGGKTLSKTEKLSNPKTLKTFFFKSLEKLRFPSIRFRVKWWKCVTAQIVCGFCVRHQNSLEKWKPVKPGNTKNLLNNSVLSHPENLPNQTTVNLKIISKTKLRQRAPTITHNVPQIHAGREFPDELPTKICFSNTNFLSTKQPNPTCGYFAVMGAVFGVRQDWVI